MYNTLQKKPYGENPKILLSDSALKNYIHVNTSKGSKWCYVGTLTLSLILSRALPLRARRLALEAYNATDAQTAHRQHRRCPLKKFEVGFVPPPAV